MTGDNVNTASRVENANKYYDTSVLVTGATFAKIDAQFFCTRKISTVRVAGKQKEIELYEISGQQSEQKKELYLLYEEALKCYDDNKLNQAENILGNLLEKFPEDGAAVHLRNRIEDARNGEWKRVEVLAK